ncbi:MAG: hypothetical protein L0241_30130 [Planctomycetia bacterium]|nr:hypothetical protein [Planctomycetia bacterium]
MWAQLVAFALGVWLTAAPQTLGYTGPARVNDHIFGPLAATVGLIAAFQVTRSVRWLNLPFGMWLGLAPWLFGYGWPELVNSTLVGLALTGLACVRGTVERAFGGGWQALWTPDATHEAAPTA